MNKILVFIQIQNKSSSGSPLENLDSILILRRLRTCYKQKRGRANFLIDRKIKNKLTDKEEELIRTQITHVVNDKPSFENVHSSSRESKDSFFIRRSLRNSWLQRSLPKRSHQERRISTSHQGWIFTEVIVEMSFNLS